MPRPTRPRTSPSKPRLKPRPKITLVATATATTGLLFTASTPAFAAPRFSSDRPGFSNATQVAPRGHLIAELGLAAANFEPGGQQLALGNLLMRTGLTPWLEARWRLPAPSWMQSKSRLGTDRSFGLTDPTLGFKVGSLGTSFVTASLGMDLSLPLGTLGFGATKAGLTMDLNLDWTLAKALVLTTNGVLSSAWTTDRRYPHRAPGYAASLALYAQVAHKLNLYAQGFVIGAQHQATVFGAGLGAALQLTPRAQIDLSCDLNLWPTTTALVQAGTTWMF